MFDSFDRKVHIAKDASLQPQSFNDFFRGFILKRTHLLLQPPLLPSCHIFALVASCKVVNPKSVQILVALKMAEWPLRLKSAPLVHGSHSLEVFKRTGAGIKHLNWGFFHFKVRGDSAGKTPFLHLCTVIDLRKYGLVLVPQDAQRLSTDATFETTSPPI